MVEIAARGPQKAPEIFSWCPLCLPCEQLSLKADGATPDIVDCLPTLASEHIQELPAANAVLHFFEPIFAVRLRQLHQ